VPIPVEDNENVYPRDLDTGQATLASINDLGGPGDTADYLGGSAQDSSTRVLTDGGGRIVFHSPFLNLAAPGAPAGMGTYFRGVFLKRA